MRRGKSQINTVLSEYRRRVSAEVTELTDKPRWALWRNNTIVNSRPILLDSITLAACNEIGRRTPKPIDQIARRCIRRYCVIDTVLREGCGVVFRGPGGDFRILGNFSVVQAVNDRYSHRPDLTDQIADALMTGQSDLTLQGELLSMAAQLDGEDVNGDASEPVSLPMTAACEAALKIELNDIPGLDDNYLANFAIQAVNQLRILERLGEVGLTCEEDGSLRYLTKFRV